MEAFLGRVSDPRATAGGPAPDADAALRAVMFTDIVGSTEMTARLGDVAALELVRAHDALVRRSLAVYRGREVREFLEKASDRLRAEGYTVEIDEDEGQIHVFVDGYEVRWRPPAMSSQSRSAAVSR